MDDPIVKHMMLTGLAPGQKEPEEMGIDYFGHQLYEGDTVYDYDGTYFLEDELSSETIAILELMGIDKFELKK